MTASCFSFARSKRSRAASTLRIHAYFTLAVNFVLRFSVNYERVFLFDPAKEIHMPLVLETPNYRINRVGAIFLALRKEDGEVLEYKGERAADFYLDLEEWLERDAHPLCKTDDVIDEFLDNRFELKD